MDAGLCPKTEGEGKAAAGAPGRAEEPESELRLSAISLQLSAFSYQPKEQIYRTFVEWACWEADSRELTAE
jgi:hypothetical protein